MTTVVDDRTPHKNLPLPHVDNQLGDDVERIREAIGKVDAELNRLSDDTFVMSIIFGM